VTSQGASALLSRFLEFVDALPYGRTVVAVFRVLGDACSLYHKYKQRPHWIKMFIDYLNETALTVQQLSRQNPNIEWRSLQTELRKGAQTIEAIKLRSSFCACFLASEDKEKIKLLGDSIKSVMQNKSHGVLANIQQDVQKLKRESLSPALSPSKVPSPISRSSSCLPMILTTPIPTDTEKGNFTRCSVCQNV
jgi:hypothetical protein